MKVIEKKISELRPADKNVRLHPQKQIDEMKRSVEMFGQYRPLVVTSDGEILVGNGLYETFVQMGKETIECLVLPDNTTDDQKKKIMLADNKIFSLGKDFLANIDEILGGMNEFDIPGFDDDVLKGLYEEISEEVRAEDVMPKGFGIIPEERINQIKEEERKREEKEPVDDESKYALSEQVLENHENNDQTGNYITCPHCGVKIYGYN